MRKFTVAPNRFQKVFVLTLALAIVVVFAMITRGSIPAPNGVITACVEPSSGTIHLIDTARTSRCHPNQILVTWNQKGSPGLQGPQGPQGLKETALTASRNSRQVAISPFRLALPRSQLTSTALVVLAVQK